jgi:membrane fusion protein, multidrug efflux system
MRKFSTIVLLACLGLAACSGKRDTSTPKVPDVRGVRVEKVVTQQVDQSYQATGTVRARTQTLIAARILGTVTSVHVREGDRINARQVLVEIDNRDSTAQLQRAQAGVRQAESGVVEADQAINAAQSAKSATEATRRLASSTLARYEVLLDRKSISQQEFDEVKAKHEVAVAEADRAEKTLGFLAAKKKQAQASVEQANAEVSSAQVQLGYSRVTSPSAGTVIAKHVEAGSTTPPGTPLLTIEDTSQYRLEAAVEESQIARIKLKDPVIVRIDSVSTQDMAGTVAEILPATDPSSRTYTVKITIPSNSLLRSGMFGTAQFATGKREALLVPSSALMQRGQLTSLYCVDEQSIARLRIVRTGKTFGGLIEVLSGLNAGERIVATDTARVADGSRVQ